MHKILSKIKEAKKLGGKILIGGNREFLKGELKKWILCTTYSNRKPTL